MERVNISTLKKQLSGYLRKVRGGETVIVLHRSRPIARIEPIPPFDTDDEALARRYAEGTLVPPRGPKLPDDFFTVERPKSKRSVLDALLEERWKGR